jgi:adenylate kinase family enzyme
MTRIHIIGGPGSGKTTLAQRFSTHLNLPFYELDVIGWEGGFGLERPPEARLHDTKQIAMQPSWVTEGSFLGWTEELFRSADYIIWLDLPWRIAAWRIVLRHARASLAGNNRHRGLLKLWRFLLGTRVYYYSMAGNNHTRENAAKYLATCTNKLIRCRRPSEVEAYFYEVVTSAQ